MSRFLFIKKYFPFKNGLKLTSNSIERMKIDRIIIQIMEKFYHNMALNKSE